MLSCRYAIRSMDLDYINVCSALKLAAPVKGAKSEPEVEFSSEDLRSIPIITKMNSLLFQALEEILWKQNGEKDTLRTIRPTHGISEAFLNDLVVVVWPDEKNDTFYMDSETGMSVDGEELRNKMFLNGFKFGGQKMMPLLAGAGAARQGKYLFIREDLRGKVLDRITLGLLKTDEGKTKLNLQAKKTFCLAKVLAYIGLADTDGQSLSELKAIWEEKFGGDGEPNPADELIFTKDSIVVVPDVKGPLGIGNLGDYVVENDNENGGDVGIRKLKPEDHAVYTDGYGMICIDWAERFNRLMHCRKAGKKTLGANDFYHRGFIIRMPFVKGALIECDFSKYLKEVKGPDAEIIIRDIWGDEHKLEDVRIILTESMFKGSKLYGWLADALATGETVWSRYIERFNGSGMSLVIAGQDSAPRKQTRLNYQFISSMQPNDEDLKKLIEPDLENHRNYMQLLHQPKADEQEEYAKKVAECFANVVIEEEQQNLELSQDEEQGEKIIEEEAIHASTLSECSDFSSLLAHLIRKYPNAAYTRTVQDQISELMVKSAMDVAQGRITVSGDTRLLVGDPFLLLNKIAGEEKNKSLLQSNGWVFAPGMEEEQELLVLRNPHVSIFEAIISKNIDLTRAEDKEKRELYKRYFGSHAGCLFANTAVSATVGGADYDGDRVKIVSGYPIQLVKRTIERIYEILKASEDPNFRIEETYNANGKALPIVNINPFSTKNQTTEEVNHAFWENVLYSYQKSMSNRVGQFSLRVARLSFNRGMVAEANHENKDERNAAIVFLKAVARMSTVIGLEIDSAKSGEPPKEFALPVMGKRAPVLLFSRYVKDHGSSKLKGLELYKAAVEWALEEDQTDEPKDSTSENADGKKQKKQDLSSLRGTPAGRKLVEIFAAGIVAKDENGDLMEDLLKIRKPFSFKRALYMELEGDSDEKFGKAMKEVTERIKKSSSVKSAARQMEESSKQINDRIMGIKQYLLSRYPLKLASELEAKIYQSRDGVTLSNVGINLENDESLMPVAFATNDERKGMLQSIIFGESEGEGFVFDETAIQLAKEVVRWRTAHKNQDGEGQNGGVPILFGQLKEEIRQVAKKYGVDCWELGLYMLKKDEIQERMFVILFGDRCPGKTKEKSKEVKTDAKQTE